MLFHSRPPYDPHSAGLIGFLRNEPALESEFPLLSAEPTSCFAHFQDNLYLFFNERYLKPDVAQLAIHDFINTLLVVTPNQPVSVCLKRLFPKKCAKNL